MQLFLEKLAGEIGKRFGDNLSGLCIVFPSRRAVIHFKKYLAAKFDNPFWAPAVYSINDFIQKLSPYMIADKLVLTFELYESYKKFGEDETFDRFYPWGEMLLNDFDEVDKNLINGGKLFRIIRELKQVDEEFQFLLSDIEEFRKFWQIFSAREPGELQKEFIKTWEIIGRVYEDFKNTLKKKNICYEGMANRSIYEDLKTHRIEIKWEKVIFAGFNMLSGSETGIIKELLKQDKALLYWDTDKYYLDDSKQEAGKYLRENFKQLGITSPEWKENYLTGNGDRSIRVIGAPLKTGQAKALGDILSEVIKKTGFQHENTAIILPDENLLLPVLYSLPNEIKSLNVTMGFPLKNTPLYNLIELLRNLQKNKKSGKNQPVFYHKDVIEIFMHPYIKYYNPAFIYERVEDIKKNNLVYLTPARILDHSSNAPDLIKNIFTDVNTIDEAFGYLYKILNILSEGIDEKTDKSTAPEDFEREYFFNVYEQLNRLKNINFKYQDEMTLDIFWRILTEVLRSIRIPFTGEPLEGMQVMGLLETRALDFDNIFILSMNEGIMPSGNRYNSFIPYSLRKAFKLPTYEEQDSLSAYYFYRLLQRAKNAYLFYDTEVQNQSAGEMSRFLLQAENELRKINQNIDFEHYVIETEAGSAKIKEIIINKTPELLQKLKDVEYFTPSNLMDYINCKLQFYLKKIAGIREEEAIEEFFSPATFGNIVHKLIQDLYSPYKNKIITRETIANMKEKLDGDFDVILFNVFHSIEGLKEIKELQGKNLLLKGVIKKLVHNILDNDSLDTPFKLVDTESRVKKQIQCNVNGEEIKTSIEGRIDRIDERNGRITIIDYKTGNVQFRKRGRLSYVEYFDVIFEDPKYKENFQAYCYAYLYLNNNNRNDLNIAIYPLRKISEGLRYLNDDNIPDDELNLLDQKIKKLIEQIFDPSIPFSQTADKERCKYCTYKSICYRE
jgi:CRISPR/Cas system-associated exonuclease Cas4 (RecB family)